MAPSNVRVISRFIDLIETVSRTASLRSLVLTDSKAFSRHRKLSFNTVTYLILNLLKKSLQVELKLFFSQLQIPVEQQFTKGAFSQRRHQINSGWFKYLLEYLGTIYYELGDHVQLWNGYKLLAIDGSTAFLISSQEANSVYKGARNKYGSYPLCRFMKMYDVLNNITLKVAMLSMENSERKCAYDWVDAIPDNSLTLFDRGFPSFTLFFLLQSCETPKAFIARCKLDFSNSIKAFVASGAKSRMITFYADDNARKVLRSYGYILTKDTGITLRVEKIKLPNGTVEVLITSLTDTKKISNEELKWLYRQRWGIETAIGREKNLLQLENYSSHLLQGIEQDFFATFIAANIHSMVAGQAQSMLKKENKQSKYDRQINYSASMHAFKEKVLQLFYTQQLKKVLWEMAIAFKQFTEPIRSNRNVERKKTSKRRYGKHQTQKNYRNNI
jgi:hypothetical protein